MTCANSAAHLYSQSSAMIGYERLYPSVPVVATARAVSVPAGGHRSYPSNASCRCIRMRQRSPRHDKTRPPERAQNQPKINLAKPIKQTEQSNPPHVCTCGVGAGKGGAREKEAKGMNNNTHNNMVNIDDNIYQVYRMTHPHHNKTMN